MKRIISFILTGIIMLTMSQVVFAANGDIAGTIYSTDIKACINGVWVDSYNIGGKTVVIVEDITNQFAYSDALRALTIDDLSPDFLVSGGKAYSQKPGTPVGKIYETDIKTFFRGKELTSYSLNGKMAIVIEELGGDNTFSDIGGKFVWNAGERTISLESMYRYPYEIRNMLSDKHLNMMLNDVDNVLKAELSPAPLLNGEILCEKVIPDNSIIPVLYNEEIIGYRCRFPEVRFAENENGDYSLEEWQSPVDYFYIDKIKDMISDIEPVKPTVEDWLNYLKNNALTTIKESFETDEYMFLYAYSAHSHGGTDVLIKLNKADGKRIDYDDNFKSVSFYGQKAFENVVIDKDNEKVYLHYDVDYIIDLKTDTIEPVEEKEDLLLIKDVSVD